MTQKSHKSPDTDTDTVDAADAAIVAVSEPVDASVATSQGQRSTVGRRARLLRGALRVAGFAVGTTVHTVQATVGTTFDVGRQIAQVALDSESQIDDVAEFAGNRLRELARDTLGLGEPSVREVVSYVPVGAVGREVTGESGRAVTLAALRRRGDELLALSADVYYCDEVHPAFGGILDQLAPDEARILRFLAVHGPQPIVDVRTNRPLGIGSELIAAGLTSVPVQARVRHPDRARSYLINLERLGLVVVRSEPVLLNRYMVLEVQPSVVSAVKRAGRAPKIVRKRLQLTEFGDDFCHTCFTLDQRALPAAEPE